MHSVEVRSQYNYLHLTMTKLTKWQLNWTRFDDTIQSTGYLALLTSAFPSCSTRFPMETMQLTTINKVIQVASKHCLATNKKCRPQQTTASAYWPAHWRRWQLSCNVFSGQLHELCQTAASTTEYRWTSSAMPNAVDQMQLRLHVQVHKCQHSVTTKYLVDRHWPVTSIDRHIHLRPANCGQLRIPLIRVSTYEKHAFWHAGPSTWSTL